jgi:hypothetical protein
VKRRLFVLLLGMLLLPAWASADGVRYYVENGVTYAETTRTVRRPVCETRYEERERTVYRRQTRTELKETQRNVLVPVTEYRREPHLVGRWNPLVALPYVVERLVPRTRWESRTETVKVPLCRTELVPEKRIERVPIVTRRIVEEPIVSRVVVTAPPAGESGALVAGQRRIGGVSKLDSDPPRQGAGEWRAASDTKRR